MTGSVINKGEKYIFVLLTNTWYKEQFLPLNKFTMNKKLKGEQYFNHNIICYPIQY